MSYRSTTWSPSKDAHLLIYFSGEAESYQVVKKGTEKRAFKVYISEEESVDLREMVSTMDVIERTELRVQMQEKEYSEIAQERYLNEVGRLSDAVKIVYDIYAPGVFD